MKKRKKWMSICLVVCLIGGIGGAAWYHRRKLEERRLSLVYIPKVEDSTNDFWKALILGTKMAAKEYNADIEIKAPNEENDIERQNELLKEAISAICETTGLKINDKILNNTVSESMNAFKEANSANQAASNSIFYHTILLPIRFQ